MRYIWNIKGKYGIRKFINGKWRRYGTYDKLTDAQKVRDLLIELNWGCSQPKDPMRNIHKYKRGDYERYILQKRRNREIIWNSTYKTLEEAMSERDLLESVDWNVDLI